MELVDRKECVRKGDLAGAPVCVYVRDERTWCTASHGLILASCLEVVITATCGQTACRVLWGIQDAAMFCHLVEFSIRCTPQLWWYSVLVRLATGPACLPACLPASTYRRSLGPVLMKAGASPSLSVYTWYATVLYLTTGN